MNCLISILFILALLFLPVSLLLFLNLTTKENWIPWPSTERGPGYTFFCFSSLCVIGLMGPEKKIKAKRSDTTESD